MKIQDVPFCTVDWSAVEPSTHPGVTGEARWRTFEMGNIRVRMVDYTPGYLADHWCDRGHVLLEGELIAEMSDGRKFTLTPGSSYQVAEDANPHRSHTERARGFSSSIDARPWCFINGAAYKPRASRTGFLPAFSIQNGWISIRAVSSRKSPKPA